MKSETNKIILDFIAWLSIKEDVELCIQDDGSFEDEQGYWGPITEEYLEKLLKKFDKWRKEP